MVPGTSSSLYPWPLGLSQPREKESQCITWPPRGSNSGMQLDSLSFFSCCLQGPHSCFSFFAPPVLPCLKCLSAALSLRYRNPWGHAFHIPAVPRQPVWMNETARRNKSWTKIDTELRVGGARGNSGTTFNWLQGHCPIWRGQLLTS